MGATEKHSSVEETHVSAECSERLLKIDWHALAAQAVESEMRGKAEEEAREACERLDLPEATQKQSLAEERAREVVVCPELQEKRDGGGGQWSPRRWLDEKEKRERQSQVETETREASKCPERPEATKTKLR